jgi:hypothetical protein
MFMGLLVVNVAMVPLMVFYGNYVTALFNLGVAVFMGIVSRSQ